MAYGGKIVGSGISGVSVVGGGIERELGICSNQSLTQSPSFPPLPIGQWSLQQSDNNFPNVHRNFMQLCALPLTREIHVDFGCVCVVFLFSLIPWLFHHFTCSACPTYFPLPPYPLHHPRISQSCMLNAVPCFTVSRPCVNTHSLRVYIIIKAYLHGQWCAPFARNFNFAFWTSRS